jgi:hypothetical protein
MRGVQRGRPVSSRQSRTGTTVAEVLITLLCLSILVVLSVRALAGLGRVVNTLQVRASWVEAARAARWILKSELDVGTRGRDWWIHAPDSVKLRAFRGTALVCAHSDKSTFSVRVRAMRRPDPDKDSVLALLEDGAWAAAQLVSADPSSVACSDSAAGRPEQWTVRGLEAGAASDVEPVMFRLFESGSYHLGGSDLRYRRGSGGAQPITEQVLSGARLVEGTSPEAAGGLEVQRPGGARARWRVLLAGVR